jgi:hypothetical protein
MAKTINLTAPARDIDLECPTRSRAMTLEDRSQSLNIEERSGVYRPARMLLEDGTGYWLWPDLSSRIYFGLGEAGTGLTLPVRTIDIILT